MERVAIIGPGGAGKSTLARALGGLTGLPVVHLDREHWLPGWVEPPPEVWAARVEDLAARDRWIIDGNYGGTMEARLSRADTVVYLDFTRRTCVWRVLKRRFQYRDRGTSRPDMADGCEETIDWKFLAWLWTYPAKRRANTLRLLAEAHRQGTRVVILQDSAQVAAFLWCVSSRVPIRPAGLDRINLIGGAGAGKSTLAARIGDRLGLPVVDGTLSWREGPPVPSLNSRLRSLDLALAGPRWVLAGPYWHPLARRLEAGQVAVFLDRSTSIRVRRILHRRRYGLSSEGRISEIAGLAWAIAFPFGERRHLVRALASAAPHQPVFVVRTDAESAAILEGFAPARTD